MTYARQSQLEVVTPSAGGLSHIRFEGDYATFCGKNCENFVCDVATPSSLLSSTYGCKRCIKAMLK